MSNSTNSSSSNTNSQILPNFDSNKFYEIELQKLFDAMLSIQTLRTQVAVFFGTANLAALSVAFTSQKTGLVVFSALLLAVFLVTDLVAINALKRLYFRATLLQEAVAPHGEQTYLTVILPYYWKKSFEKMKQYSSIDERDKAINRLFLSARVIPGFWLPLLSGLTELLAAIVLGIAFNWKTF